MGRSPRRLETRRRFTLSEEERDLARRSRADPHSARELVRVVVREPRLAPAILAAAVRAIRTGLVADGSLVWLLDVQRLRRLIPDAAAGAEWVGEDLFLEPLLRRLSPEMRVLDFGCGGGRIARHVAPLATEVVCADRSDLFLREARENLADHRNVAYVRTHEWSISGVADESVDLAFAQGVFSYVEPFAFLALLVELRRVLRAGGRLVLNVFTIDSDLGRTRAVAAAELAIRRNRQAASAARPYTQPTSPCAARRGGLSHR